MPVRRDLRMCLLSARFWRVDPCPKCSGRVVRQVEHNQQNAVEVDVCQLCGHRLYLDVKRQAIEKCSPGGGLKKKSRPVAELVKERDMAKKSDKKVAACLECNREMTIISRGLCQACRNRLKKQGTLDEKYPAFNARPGRSSGKLPHEKKCAPVDKPNIELSALGLVEDKPGKVTLIRPPEVVEAVENGAAIVLKATERDADLFAALQNWADDDRRTIHAQVLFILDKVVANKVRGIAL